MARRARHSREELRELALAAAEQIIAEQGPQNLTIREVARRVGCSVGTLYNNFANAQDLILNLDARTLDMLHDALCAAPRSGEPERDLRLLLEAYLRFIEAHPDRWRLMFVERQPGSAFPPDWYLARVARLFTLLEEIISPLFGPDEAGERGTAARLLWLSLHGVWSLAATDQLGIVTSEPLQNVAQGMVRVFLAGLRRRDPSSGFRV